jgi:hypothetical protein
MQLQQLVNFYRQRSILVTHTSNRVLQFLDPKCKGIFFFIQSKC